MRPLCTCGLRPAAVNYHKNGKVYYRKLCESCIKYGEGSGIPRWYTSGYRMKKVCDKCGFKSTVKAIFRVFHVDGDLNNCRPNNLKTVCANCAISLHQDGVQWKQGGLTPDL